MRQAGLQVSPIGTSCNASLRAVRLAVLVLGVSVVAMGGIARADDDDEDAPPPSIMDNIMSSIGAKPATDEGIKYRERSPLVVPSKTELAPPAPKRIIARNWPKDPDEIARKEALAATKNDVGAGEEVRTMGRALLPSEMSTRPIRRRPDTAAPGAPEIQNKTMLSPSELGYKGGLFSGVFGGNKSESAPFTGEPDRQTLMQPPTGYQTPSPNFAYGSGPRENMVKEYNPAAGKYGNN